VGRVAVVTGASSGIGAEIARLLSARGDLCILLARRADRLQALAEELGGEAEPCDVSDRAAVEAVAERVLARHPKIDVLVNNAGVPGRTSFADGDPEVIERLIRINYLGGVWCLRAFLPGLQAAAPSDVVNIVSVSGVVAGPVRQVAPSSMTLRAAERAAWGSVCESAETSLKVTLRPAALDALFN